MKTLPKDLTENDIINFIGEFVNLLAEEKYVEAFEMTYQIDEHLSPTLIEQLIQGYGIDEPAEEVYRVTSLEKMQSQSPRIEFFFYDSVESDDLPREIGSVDYDLPINGEWSDLTAIFYIYELENGISLSIYDIHVL